jgi:hypothetical protein
MGSSKEKASQIYVTSKLPSGDLWVKAVKGTEKVKRNQWAKIRAEAWERFLKYGESDDDRKNFKQELMREYGYGDEIKKMSPVQLQTLLSKHVNHDWLVIEMIDDAGNLSDYAEQYYPWIDPFNYEHIGLSWNAAKKELERRLETEYRGSSSVSYVGYIGTMDADEDNDDVVAAYAKRFGRESIVALPGEVDVRYGSISVRLEEDFFPPYGGGFLNDRAVFVPFDRNL